MGWYLSWPSSLRLQVTFPALHRRKGQEIAEVATVCQERRPEQVWPHQLCAKLAQPEQEGVGSLVSHLEAGFAAHSLAPPLCRLCLPPVGRCSSACRQVVPRPQGNLGGGGSWDLGGLEGAQQQQMAGPGISMSRREGRSCTIP